MVSNRFDIILNLILTNLKIKNNYRFFGIAFILLIVILFSIVTIYATRSEVMGVMEQDLNQASVKSSQLSLLLAGGIERGINPQESQQLVQRSLTDTGKNSTYQSILNWAGKIISHPDVNKIDDIADYYNGTSLDADNTVSVQDLYGKLDEFKEDEIVEMQSINNTDWIAVTHMNIAYYRDYKENILFKNVVLNSLTALFLVVVFLVILRFAKLSYEKQIAKNQLIFTDGVSNLTKLNKSLENYQTSMMKEINTVKEEVSSPSVHPSPDINITKIDQVDKGKSRILTYVRNELLSIAIEDISYIYVENTITYFVRNDGKKSTSNESLDQIYASLDERFFFKANRQYIVGISAIEKISKYGNSQLKLSVNPKSESDIIIGKNKAAAFKRWLDL